MKRVFYALLIVLGTVAISNAATLLWENVKGDAGTHVGTTPTTDTTLFVDNTSAAAGLDTTDWFPLFGPTAYGNVGERPRGEAIGDITTITFRAKTAGDSIIITSWYLQTSEDKITVSADSVALTAVAYVTITTPVGYELIGIQADVLGGVHKTSDTTVTAGPAGAVYNGILTGVRTVNTRIPVARWGRIVVKGQTGAEDFYLTKMYIRAWLKQNY
jgi:hypothetical protein